MLPTPSTSHVSFDRVYEPAEDSYLLLDTLSHPTETTFLTNRFNPGPTTVTHRATSLGSPFVIEVGTGSGVVLSFLNAHAEAIFGSHGILTAGIDVNPFACLATRETVRAAENDQVARGSNHGLYLGNLLGDLTYPLRDGQVNLMIFNPPYVPTPSIPSHRVEEASAVTNFERDSALLELSYAGGVDGMEVTDRLLSLIPQTLDLKTGVAYILLCAQNKPDIVKRRIRTWGNDWKVETVGRSGKTGGWEKLQVIRIWR